MNTAAKLFLSGCCCLVLLGSVRGAELRLETFQRQQLTDVYFSEGANAGDLNGDGVLDVVYGPYWFAGPDYQAKQEIYPAAPQDRERYADNFFSWVYDFNGDRANDVFVVGFPGTPAYVYENPGPAGLGQHWVKHQVFDWVSNESPQFMNLVGDERPELICTRDGFFGFATVNWDQPWAAWPFHPISAQVAAARFGHGLGVGDLSGDGRADILHAQGWFEQPAANADNARWVHHEVSFSNAYGGADMLVYDVDGDGDHDVITSHAAHDFGLGWYEQTKDGDQRVFQHHLIMGAVPAENRYGVVFSELHALNLADFDGDGLQDVVTGKTYYSHHQKSPMWDAGAVVYWFKLVRGAQGVEWIPYRADGEAGIGRQLSLADLDKNGTVDIIVGGMKGAHVLRHTSQVVTRAEWEAAQPKVFVADPAPAAAAGSAARGPKSSIDGQTGRVAHAIEGENLTSTAAGGAAGPQAMSSFKKDRWSGAGQLWWTGGKAGDKLTINLPPFSGVVNLELVLTRAKDYGIVQLSLDDQALGEPIDLYSPDVVTTGVLSFPKLTTAGDQHRLVVQITGANPRAVPAFMFGLDYLRVQQADGAFVAGPPPAANKPAAAVAANAAPVEAAAVGVAPRDASGRALNFDFESGKLDDWTAEGDAFRDQPIDGDTISKRRGDMRSGHADRYWIGGYEKHGDQPVGTLTSAPFVATHPYASFLMAGGQHEETRVELIRQDTGKVFFKMNGRNDEQLDRVVVDLRAHSGKEIRVRLVDNHRGGWGHVNFDHFRLHEVRPAPLTPPLIALVPDEYPYTGLSAPQAAAAMKLPEGFSVIVGAAEPDVKQPIAMAIDDRGRVWVAEAYEYPVRASGDQGRDRILIFADSDGDGTLDQHKVFAEGLNLVSGLEVGFGGVWVGAAPYLLFIPDANADDAPDGPPQILLDGWGFQDTHETLNAFLWGPDGWLYGCHGVFTHSRVGRPGTPDEQRIPLNAAIWRYHPTRHQFEVFAHGTSNPWGVDFNDHGQAFATACVIPHLYHIVQGGRYQRQAGPHFNPYTYRDIVTIADHLHYLGATPHGGNSKSDAAGGGHAHAGAMIYLGDRWPQQYRNQLFMNNIHGQRLNIDVLQPNGSGYVGSHAPDFLLTGDQASQILNLRYGPDGNAWMIDWYDMQACHRPEVAIHDRSNGRIYKIIHGDPAQRAEQVDLGRLSDAELAALTLHANDWYVRHSRRLLQERAAKRALDPAAVAQLQSIAVTHGQDTRRLRAAWALHATGNLSAELQQRLLADPSHYVRGWAVQLALEAVGDQPSAALLDQFAAMAAGDESPVVRLYLAAAAQRIPLAQRWNLLHALTSHTADASDHNLPLLYWYAAEPLAELDATRALALAMSAGEAIPLLREFMLRRIGSSDAAASLDVLVKGLDSAADAKLQLTFLQAIRAALRGQRQVAAPAAWSQVGGKLLASDDEQVRLQANALGVVFGDSAALAAMRSLAASDAAPVAARAVALQSLLDAKDADLVGVLKSLLAAEGDLQQLALRGLAQYDDPQIAAVLLAAYPRLAPDRKRMALGTLCSRAPWAVALLNAIEGKQVPGTDLTADLVGQLQYLKHAEVTELLGRVWGTARESAADKLQLIAQLKALVGSAAHPPVDVELGRAVFAKTCLKCHLLYGVGHQIGPDLTGSNRANLDYLLGNIVDPSSVMAKEYRATVVVTRDGRIVTGLVKAEDAKSVTLQTSDALVVVPKNEIDERTESDKSMMPDDQLKQFGDHEVRSLVAYLQGQSQTPLLATAETAATIFNGVDLAGWSGRDGLWSVENGELVGRTDGLRRNEWLVSDLSAANFRLTLEVKLVDNAGNSGVQFRSRARDGVVSGYQADVGKGWWGKLYEEHGRGLLWDKSGEQFVKEGDWNQYEIIADGHRVRTRINGHDCVDLHDPDGALRGVIALQLHSGGQTEVRFRHFQLELLPVPELTAAGITGQE